jgi:hypothetical protein
MQPVRSAPARTPTFGKVTQPRKCCPAAVVRARPAKRQMPLGRSADWLQTAFYRAHERIRSNGIDVAVPMALPAPVCTS